MVTTGRRRTSRARVHVGGVGDCETGTVLIVLSGPIASGKSTLARALARELGLRGRSAAACDLDLLYEMLAHERARKDDEQTWQRARRAAATLANALLEDGIDVVIVEGDFLTASKISSRRASATGSSRGLTPPSPHGS
jgi:adenylylsulfate kinase-like enzyme